MPFSTEYGIVNKTEPMSRLIVLIVCLFAINLHAQYQPAKIFVPGDSIVVKLSPELGKVYTHKMEAKETAYSLAKTFGQRIGDLQLANPNMNFDQLNVGQSIQVPFLSSVLVKNVSDKLPGKVYIPVYYEVKAKDNFFRIARVYFNQSIENLLDMNQLETFDLSIGQYIQVGWLNMNQGSAAMLAQQTVAPQKVIHNPVVTSPTPKQDVVKEVQRAPKSETRTSSNKEARAKKPKKFMAKLKKTFGIKSKKKDITDIVTLSEQLEETPEFQEPAQRKPIVEENKMRIAKEKLDNEVAIKQRERVMIAPPAVNEIGDLKEKPELPVEEIAPVPDAPEIVYKSEKGIAIWNQTSSNSKNMFALHPTAKVGTYIEITNPMMNKTVQAKVIGNIPPRTYTDDVSLVISPRVAKMLGVVDRRFMAKIKYREM